MSWKPATTEPTPTELAIVDAIRAAVVPAGAIGSVRTDPDNVLIVDRPGASQLRAVFSITHDARTTHGVRLARRILLQGRAIQGTSSLVLSATVVLDLATGAMLEVDYEIVSQR